MSGTASKVSEEGLETYLREQYDAFDQGNAEAVDSGWFIGYGYRSKMPRAEIEEEMRLSFTQLFFDVMEYYSIKIDELNVAVDGDTGLTWGFHSEDFQMKGQEPEKLRVRFSMTLKHDADQGWKVIMGHRDIQPFDENDMYIPSHNNAVKF